MLPFRSWSRIPSVRVPFRTAHAALAAAFVIGAAAPDLAGAEETGGYVGNATCVSCHEKAAIAYSRHTMARSSQPVSEELFAGGFREARSPRRARG